MLGSSPSALGRKNEGEVLTMPQASGGLPGGSQTKLPKVCAVTQSMCVCRESLCTQRGCAYIVCGFCHVRRAGSGLGLGSLPEETRPYSDPWAGRKGGGCGCRDFSPAEKGFPLG